MISEQSRCCLMVRERITPKELPGKAYALVTGWRELISTPGWEGLITSESWAGFPFFYLCAFSFDKRAVLSRAWAGSWPQILRLTSVPDVSGETADLSGVGVANENISKQWQDGVRHRVGYEKALLLCLLLPRYGQTRLGIGKDWLYFTPYRSPHGEILYEEGVFGWSFFTNRYSRLPDGIIGKTYDFLVHLLGVADFWAVERSGKYGDEWVLSWKMPNSVAITGNFSLSAKAFSWEEAKRPTEVRGGKFPDVVARCTTPDEIWYALSALQTGEISRMYWARKEAVPMWLGNFPEIGLA